MWNGFVHSPLTYYLRKKNKNWSFANWWLILCRFLRQSRIDRFRVKWLSPFVRLQWKFLIWFQIQFAHSAVGSWWYLLNATRWPELVPFWHLSLQSGVRITQFWDCITVWILKKTKMEFRCSSNWFMPSDY